MQPHQTLKNILFGSPIKANLILKKPNAPRSKGKGFLSLFEVIKFPNTKCSVSMGDIRSMEGVCYHEFECKSLGGIPTESCAEGVGVCCVCEWKYSDRFAWYRNTHIYLTSFTCSRQWMWRCHQPADPLLRKSQLSKCCARNDDLRPNHQCEEGSAAIAAGFSNVRGGCCNLECVVLSLIDFPQSLAKSPQQWWLCRRSIYSLRPQYQFPDTHSVWHQHGPA